MNIAKLVVSFASFFAMLAGVSLMVECEPIKMTIVGSLLIASSWIGAYSLQDFKR